MEGDQGKKDRAERFSLLFQCGWLLPYRLYDLDSWLIPDLVKKIAFVMNKRAELGGWRAVENLTEDDFYDWLDTIDSYEIETNGEKIINIYARNKKTSVSPKNTISPQAE